MNRLTPQALLDIISAAELRARSYSGRGSYGELCVGVEVERGDVFCALSALTLAAIDMDGAEAWAEVMAGTKTDSMGLASIIYWPRLRWPGEESDAPSVGPQA